LSHTYAPFESAKQKKLLEGLPKLKFENDRICEACQKEVD